MSCSGQSRPSLRLVNAADDTPAPPCADSISSSPSPDTTSAIDETRAASRLSADEAAAIFAIRVQSQLQAGRAAVLTPERRRALIAGSVGLGVKAFDANLVIAVVQSAVRAGEDPLVRLRVTGPSDAKGGRSRANRLILAVVLVATALLWLVFVLSDGARVGR